MGCHQKYGYHQKIFLKKHHFGVNPITTVFFVEEIRVIEFYPDLRLSDYSQFQSYSLLQISMGCHQQCGDHHKVHEKCFTLVQVVTVA